MASRKSGGGFKSAIFSTIIIALILAAVIGWAKVNDIHNIAGVYNYFKSASDHAWECGAGEATWNCSESGATNQSDGSSQGNNNTTPDKNNNAVETPTEQTETKDAFLSALDSLKIEDPQEVEFKPADWKHWTGSPCNVRDKVLAASGKNVKQDSKTCKILSGSWTDEYTGEELTNPDEISIDHIIPLRYAAMHGGQKWDNSKKEEFANDTSQLIAISASEESSKADKGPSDYLPSNKDFKCTYAKAWVSTAQKYNVSITKSDKTKLVATLQKCDK